jgi:hypothetical protein
LETPLWQYPKNAECEKGTPPVRLPIPYVPPTDLLEKQETEQIKDELPDGTKFQMPTFGFGKNKEYLVPVIAVLHLVEQKGTAAKVQEAYAALITIRKEMSPFFNFPEDDSVTTKEARKKKLTSLMSPSRPRKPSLSKWPRRRTNYSVALLLARRECNGTGLSTQCTQ